jgi:hypothetical protein
MMNALCDLRRHLVNRRAPRIGLKKRLFSGAAILPENPSRATEKRHFEQKTTTRPAINCEHKID